MGNRTHALSRTAACASAAQSPIRGPQTDAGPSHTDRHCVCAFGYCVGSSSPGDGLRFGHRLLAKTRGMAESWCLATYPRNAVDGTAPAWATRYGARYRRQFFNSCHGVGKKQAQIRRIGARPGSKHHIIVDAHGIPLAVILTGANVHDVTQLHALVEAIPCVRGKRGCPLREPKIVQGAVQQFRGSPPTLARAWHAPLLARLRTPGAARAKRAGSSSA